MKVIFLDIDGVLNSGRSFLALSHRMQDYPRSEDPYYAKITKSTIDEVSVELLNRVLREFGAHLVLSSTHRMHFEDGPDKLAQIQTYLSFLGVDGSRCVGYTPRLNSIRGEEIAQWLDGSGVALGVTDFIILDDSSDFLPEQLPQHVHCAGGHGITEANFFEMCKLFGREPSGLILM